MNKTNSNNDVARDAGRLLQLASAIDDLLEAMWQLSPERAGLTKGRRDYNYANSLFCRSHREAVTKVAHCISK